MVDDWVTAMRKRLGIEDHTVCGVCGHTYIEHVRGKDCGEFTPPTPTEPEPVSDEERLAVAREVYGERGHSIASWAQRNQNAMENNFRLLLDALVLTRRALAAAEAERDREADEVDRLRRELRDEVIRLKARAHAAEAELDALKRS